MRKALKSISLINLSKLNRRTTSVHPLSLSHTHTHVADGKEGPLYVSPGAQEKKINKKKRSLTVPFPLAHRQPWPKHTGTLSSLLPIHIILSLCSLCKDTNFPTSPSSQSICSKIVVERGEADTWWRLRLKAGLNGEGWGDAGTLFPSLKWKTIV